MSKIEKKYFFLFFGKNKENELNAQQVLSEGTNVLNDYTLLEEIVYMLIKDLSVC